MHSLPESDRRAAELTAAIRRGDVASVREQLTADPALARVRIVDAKGSARTLPHIVADWPGHVPNGAALIGVLASAGADLNAPMMHGRHGGSPETALHWAASSDDVAVLDALLDHGAHIEATGAVFTDGTAMSDAVVFAQWKAARRLLERGARTAIWQAAALGLVDRVAECVASEPAPSARDITNALWHACRGGQPQTAALLLERGADRHWVGWDDKTPIDVARESGNAELVALLAHRA
jgi:ankyrin repeat protein